MFQKIGSESRVSEGEKLDGDVEKISEELDKQRQRMRELLKTLREPAGLEATIYFRGFNELVEGEFALLDYNLKERMRIWKNNLWDRCKTNDPLTKPEFVSDDLVLMRIDRIQLTGKEKVEAVDIVDELRRTIK